MMPLTRIKTEPVVLKSILKSTKRRRKTPDDYDLPTKSIKRNNMTSDGFEVKSKSAQRGCFPPPPSLLSNNAALSRPRRKRRAKSRRHDDTKKEAYTSDDHTVELKKTPVASGKAKDIPLPGMSKDSESHNVASPSKSSISTVQRAISSDKSETAVLEGVEKIKGITVPESGSSTVTEPSSTADDKIEFSQVEKTNKDTEGQKVPPLQQDSCSLSVGKDPPEPPSISPGPSAVVVSSKLSNATRSNSVCRSLIEFENAILETGDDLVNSVMVQKTKSKRYALVFATVYFCSFKGIYQKKYRVDAGCYNYT